MTLEKILFFIICASTAVLSAKVSLPAGVKTCKRGSSDYESCSRLALQDALPIFIKGVPELNVPPLDPWITDNKVHSFDYGIVTGKVVVKHSTTHGAAGTRFLSVKPKYENNYLHVDIEFEQPTVFIEGEYETDGAIGSLKMRGKGGFNISMTDLKAALMLEGPVADDTWRIENVSLIPQIETMKVWAADLFDGNDELTQAALSFVNSQWKLLYKGMLPFAAKVWNNMTKDFLNSIFSKLSFSEVFP